MAAPGSEPALTTTFHGARADVRQLRRSRIAVVEGPSAGRVLEMVKPRVTIGRSLCNDLALDDRAVSGMHFEIVADETGYRLRDLGSTNGTWVGEMRVGEAWLCAGTVFRAGRTKLRFDPQSETVRIALSPEDRFDCLLGTSPAMREIFAMLEKVAPSDLALLVTGESGTGKEMVARAIHNASPRREGPLVVLDGGAIPRDLVESTVFGHERGAFTGAVGQHRGSFEQADGGTLFLDEIGELDLGLQPKLLRVLETRELRRVGGERTLKVDVRVVAATNRDLRRMINTGAFREDLYFRLAAVTVHMPPLRERREDVPPLVHHFLGEISARSGRRLTIALEAMRAISAHDWPGNARELRNALERAASLTSGDEITTSDLTFRDARRAPVTLPVGDYAARPFKEAKQSVLDAFEREYLRDVLGRHGGNMTRAAATAGLTRFHLRELAKRHGLWGGRDEREDEG